MAYKIEQTQSALAEISQYAVNLYGAFEGKYLLERRVFAGYVEVETYYSDTDGHKGRPTENIDIHELILDNYIQWQKEKK